MSKDKMGILEYAKRLKELSKELEIAKLPEYIEKLKAQLATNEVDANRYRFLRDADNWGEDSGDFNWDMLGDTSGMDFDIVVDERMRMHDE